VVDIISAEDEREIRSSLRTVLSRLPDGYEVLDLSRSY